MKHYNRIIETRRDLVREGYMETHHIIPKCYGGSDDRDNLVKLTAREHFVAHWLLWRANRDRKSASMFNAMTRWGRGQKRYYSSRGYEEAAEARKFANKGRKLTKEHKAKIKTNNARTGKPNWNSGKKWDKSKVECTKCGMITSLDHNRRWHEDNCQFDKYSVLLKLYTRKEICKLKNISNAALQHWVNRLKSYEQDTHRP